MVIRHVLLLALFGMHFAKGEMFRRFMSLNDTDYSSLFVPMANPPPMTLGSMIECGSYALYALNNPAKAMRATAFQYTGGRCLLGNTPTFDDQVMAKTTVEDNDGVHGIVGKKPIASVVQSDMWTYILMNEEKMFKGTAQKNLPNPPNVTGYNDVSLHYAFSMLSPVQTLVGQFAALPVGSTYLQYPVPTQVWTALTILVWYSNAAIPTNLKDPLVTLHSMTGVNSYIDFYASVTNVRDLSCRFKGSDGAYYAQVTPGGVVPSGWVYLGASWDGIQGAISLYINGTVTQSSTGVNTYKNSQTFDTVMVGTNGGDILKNYLASVEIYNRYMTAADVVVAMGKSTTSRVLL